MNISGNNLTKQEKYLDEIAQEEYLVAQHEYEDRWSYEAGPSTDCYLT